MFQLTIAYVNQVDRDREVATDLRDRLTLKAGGRAAVEVEPAPDSRRNPHRAPVRARAIGR